NSVIDILYQPRRSSVWLGTGKGLAIFHRDSLTWRIVGEASGLGKGGVSAVALRGDTVWAATAYSVQVSGTFYPAGGGIGLSTDGGATWRWMPQPIDSSDITNYRPTTTNIQNLIYDIALTDSQVWIASFGGGLRRLRTDRLNFAQPESLRWEVITVDRESFNPLLRLSHRLFSVAYDGNSLWAGSAAGVHRSDDGGNTWQSFNSADGFLTGDFVTALGIQYTGNDTLVWAATWQALRAGEYYGVCVTQDRGRTWRVALSDSTLFSSGQDSGKFLVDLYGPLRAHNFGFKGDTVFVATDGALWRSPDRGNSWDYPPLTTVYDPRLNERLDFPNFYSTHTVGDTIWIGTNEGLVMLTPSGFSIIRAFRPAGEESEPLTYAYPSPFSPRRGHITRFQFSLSSPQQAEATVLNFAGEKVWESGTISLPGGGSGIMRGYASIYWDGRDRWGSIVANGVYFYRLKVNQNILWGKVMVVD
ncbi:MAG: hypothetical protein ACK4OO_05680, partial [bacterium]